MGTYRRLNVNSGRSLEPLAHYSRALRVGDLVLQAGTTALRRDGTVRGVGNVGQQVEAIITLARWSLEKAGSRLDDVVRRRTFTTATAQVNRPYGAGPAWFAAINPAALGCRIDGPARPELLIEVEVTAVKGARDNIAWIGPDAMDALER